MRKLIFFLMVGGALSVVGCQSKDPSVDKPPPVSADARPDAANLNKQQQLQTGPAAQTDVMK
jgi:hypothetical protein